MVVPPAHPVIRFGLFELDPQAGQLSRQGVKLRLPQQPVQLLSVLLERPGEVISREELHRRLWPEGVFVDFDHGLNKSVQKLREVLGDSPASPRYIETIPRVGYRFIAPATNDYPPLAVAAPPLPAPAAPVPATPERVSANRSRKWIFAAAAVAVCAVAALYLSSRRGPATVRYTKLTDFTDSAGSPALSADGKLLAFMRGGDTFMSTDALYVKMLPNGEPRRITADPRPKYSLAFSPDDSKIAYTVLEPPAFGTFTVSTLGGDPEPLLTNAAGLTWLDADHVLFSRVRSGLHLGVETATTAGDHVREIYFPPHERAMAHYSFASPDRNFALVVEMTETGDWGRCQLISLKGAATPRPVGPMGGCTAAGWSPDGTSMYFIAWVEGESHLWRQRFPDGQPQQITLGPTEEEGLAVENNGRSVITAMGLHESALWVHDEKGERPVSSEGDIVSDYGAPLFSPDDRFLYYLAVHSATNSGEELWRMSVSTSASEPVLPGVSMSDYSISPDGQQVLYSTTGNNSKPQLWIARTDRSTPPHEIGTGNERSARFGPDRKILFQSLEGNTYFLDRMNPDGSARSRVIPYPIHEIQSVSPGLTWMIAVVLFPGGQGTVPMVTAIPLRGGALRPLCETYCLPTWASSGKFLYIPVEPATQSAPGRSLAIPLGQDEALPPLPKDGVRPFADASVVPGALVVARAGLVGGRDPDHYAYVKTVVHRNLYRVTLP